MIYKFGTKPFQHQLQSFEAGHDKPAFGYLLEQGLGKTKVCIDNACYLWTQGKVDCVIVLAPNIVHTQWVTDEIPKHVPDYIEYRAFDWTGKTTKREALRFKGFLSDLGLAFVTINYEAIITQRGSDFLQRLYMAFNRVMIIADESQRIRTPGNKTTRKAIVLAKKSKYRRIATGTPIPNGPLNFYSQAKFLDPRIFGAMTFAAFKARYAVWEQRRTNNNRQGFYLHLVSYQNLGELIERMSPFVIRFKKDQCTDLPPKIPQTVYYDLTKKQRKYYTDLLDQTALELESLFDDVPPFSSSEAKVIWMVENIDRVRANTVTIENALTKFIRLQQILCGYIVTDDGEIKPIDGKFPKLDRLMEVIGNISGKVIIWSIFTNLTHLGIGSRIEAEYGPDSYAYYNGKLSSEQKKESKRKFLEDPTCRFLIANQASGGRGLNLQVSGYNIYYSQDMDAEKREQSEDRTHRIGQEKSVIYIDLICPDHIDERILERLEEKRRDNEAVLEQL
jgi:SNF2 family DNA or RNA helicase